VTTGNILVFRFLLFLMLQFSAFQGTQVTTALEAHGSDETLDLRSAKARGLER
jgi:hypothetical protein